MDDFTPNRVLDSPNVIGFETLGSLTVNCDVFADTDGSELELPLFVRNVLGTAGYLRSYSKSTFVDLIND